MHSIHSCPDGQPVAEVSAERASMSAHSPALSEKPLQPFAGSMRYLRHAHRPVHGDGDPARNHGRNAGPYLMDAGGKLQSIIDYHESPDTSLAKLERLVG